MKTLFKVIAQQEPFQVNKQDGSVLNKCTIVLQEVGGKYENSFVCQLLGNAAVCKFYPNDFVWAALRFQHFEVQGRSASSEGGDACQSKKFYNEITVQDIVSFSNHN